MVSLGVKQLVALVGHEISLFPLRRGAPSHLGLRGALLAGKHDGAVDRVRQPAVAAAGHHGADDELAERRELAAEGGHD